LAQFRRTGAARCLAALAFEAGIDAALEARDVVVGHVGPERRGYAHDFARATGGLDEGVAQAFERAAGGMENEAMVRLCHAGCVSQSGDIPGPYFQCGGRVFLHDGKFFGGGPPFLEPQRQQIRRQRLWIALTEALDQRHERIER